MYQLVAKLKVLLSKQPKIALTQFSSQLDTFVTNLNHVFHSSLQPVKLSQTLFYEANAYELEFLSKVITSHLQTHGCTIVIGDNTPLINMFIDSLSLFLTTSSEKKRSSHVVANRNYVPDLVLQGIETTNIPDEVVIQSMLPSTLIDLTTMTVRQTHPFHEYSVLRREYLNMELEKLVSTKSRDNLWAAQDGLFRPVKAGAPCVDFLIVETFRLPHCLREAYINQSMKLLLRKASVLIKYVEAELEHVSPLTNLEASVVKKIRADLDLNNDADFTVLLGIAEKVSPGIYVALAGDPASIEAKFVELFESF